MSIESSAIAGVTEPVSNVSVEDYVARRVANSLQNQEESNEVSQDESEDQEDSQEVELYDDIEDEVEDTEGDPSGNAEIDLLDLTTEQIQELAKKGKSRLLQRFGELTAQKKLLEERLLSQAPKAPINEISAIENPFRSIETVEELSAKYNELELVMNDTDRLLEDHEDYGPEDIITVGDREFTKKEIRKANRNARDSIAKYLPAQERQIAKRHELVAMGEHFSEAAKKEIPDILDETSKTGQQFRAMMSDPIVQRVRDQIPELGAQMEYLLAHAANSINGGKSKTIQAPIGSKLRVNPSSSPIGSGAMKSVKQPQKRAAEAYSKFEQSHSVDDWISARIAQYK